MSRARTSILKVISQEPELIAPAMPTPKELKVLSDLDDVPPFRFHGTILQFYRKCELAQGKDPAKVIKEAIAVALVYYYPLAGRLKKIRRNEKLFVDCTGEGVMFVEADADVSIDVFGDVIYPPFSGVGELLCDSPESLVGTHLLHFQVTRLKCGGFVLGVRFNHILFDAAGLTQFLTAISELARGLPAPSTNPVWHRHMVTFNNFSMSPTEYQEFDHQQSKNLFTPIYEAKDGIVQSGFVFDSAAISSLRDQVTPHLPNCTTFELITAAVFQSLILSLKLDPNTDVCMAFALNARKKFDTMPIPKGYFENAIIIVSTVTTASKLKSKPLAHSVKLVQKAKNNETEDNEESNLNLSRPAYTFRISDVGQAGFQNVDYGWGKPVYGGVGTNVESLDNGVLLYLTPIKIKDNENATVMSIALPKPVMDLFTKELNILIRNLAAKGTRKKTTTGLDHRARM